ncbi:hypothetical protein ETD86_20360 [Nonomuraea turkmeniaca]|uniref:Uncharacterized protein n=1 Tax=Nonomuraea turkmeniaca TaxID=103838 RepID=A0A5S4FIH4_9ACTN|nr:hypothetical protein [Nonomuraea turkmeniaca]TMR19223.1 hypothetical protein ETD86_20360 [Nonomuraea turkmeniaca]
MSAVAGRRTGRATTGPIPVTRATTGPSSLPRFDAGPSSLPHFDAAAGDPTPLSRTDATATGPIPAIRTAPAGDDDYLPIFAQVQSAWFERGNAGDATWGSAKADAGWSAAEAAATPSDAGATTSGLPKRVPKANLVPGTAETTSAPKGVAPIPRLSPERIRSRLNSFQEGCRQARTRISTGDLPPFTT